MSNYARQRFLHRNHQDPDFYHMLSTGLSKQLEYFQRLLFQYGVSGYRWIRNGVLKGREYECSVLLGTLYTILLLSSCDVEVRVQLRGLN